MDIWAVMGQKGGTGKTTIGTNLSVEAERHGHTVALIDLDPQATATRWSDYREASTPAVIATPASRLNHWLEIAKENGATLAIVDTPPNVNDGSLKIARTASLVIVPCRSSRADIEANEPTIEMTRMAKVKTRVILNGVTAQSNLDQDSRLAIQDLGAVCAPCQLGQRIDYVHAFNQGLAASEFKPKSKPSLEIQSLYDYLANETGV